MKIVPLTFNFMQFVRYVIVGTLSFILEYSIFNFLYYYFFKIIEISIELKVLNKQSLILIISNSIAYFIVFWFCFFLNRNWSFKSKSNLKIQLLKYTLLFFFNLFFGNIFLSFLNNTFLLEPYFSKFILMLTITIWNFVIYKKIIYA